MEYVVAAAFVSVGLYFLHRRLSRGWNARNVPADSRYKTQKWLLVIGVLLILPIGSWLTDLTRSVYEYPDRAQVEKQATQAARLELADNHERADVKAEEEAKVKIAEEIYRGLVQLDPANKVYEQKRKLYQARSDGFDAKSEADINAQKRREDVRLGMSQQDVLDSSWGRPHKVNKTTTVTGTREEWVYGEYGEQGFLYFDNGVLTAIQN